MIDKKIEVVFQAEIFDKWVTYTKMFVEYQFQFMVIYDSSMVGEAILDSDLWWFNMTEDAFTRISGWYFEEASFEYLRIGPTNNPYYNSLPRLEIPQDYFCSGLISLVFTYEQLHGRIIHSQSTSFEIEKLGDP